MYRFLVMLYLKTPWRRECWPTLVFLPEESHGPSRLVGCSPWGHKESDTTERFSSLVSGSDTVFQLSKFIFLFPPQMNEWMWLLFSCSAFTVHLLVFVFYFGFLPILTDFIVFCFFLFWVYETLRWVFGSELCKKKKKKKGHACLCTQRNIILSCPRYHVPTSHKSFTSPHR